MNQVQPMYRDFKTDSLLVINNIGVVRRIFTPFRVLSIADIGAIKSGTWVYVDRIGVNSKHQLLYEINGNLYLYDLFQIYIHF